MAWQETTLGDVLTLNYGKALSDNDRAVDGEYPAYGANGVKCLTNRTLSNEPSIIVGRKGSAGEVNLTQGPFWALDVAYYASFDRNKNDLKFLFYLLRSLNLTELAKGVKPGINRDDVYSIPISLPPLDEQKRIVAILDEAFAGIDKAIANTERNLANAKELFESYLNSVFANPGEDWEEERLDEISENLDSQRVPITKGLREPGKIPYYGASGIVDYVKDFIFDENLLCVSEDGANLLARTYPIAFSISGKSWVNNHAHVLRFPDITTQKYVEIYLNSISLADYVTGMAQPKLNQAMLNMISIPMPPIDQQKRIVAKFDALSAETKRLETLYRQKLADLAELKQSILQKAFTGELTAGHRTVASSPSATEWLFPGPEAVEGTGQAAGVGA